MGGDDSFERFLDEYRGVLRAAIRRARPAALGLDPDDVEQDVRLRLWQLHQGERNIASPKSYIYRMAVNATLDAVRAIRRRREEALEGGAEGTGHGSGGDELVASGASPERVAERRLLLDRVERALGRLAARRQTAVRLHLQGFTTTEIAQLAGWTEPTARNLAYRGLADLRRLLRAEGIGYEDDD